MLDNVQKLCCYKVIFFWGTSMTQCTSITTRQTRCRREAVENGLCTFHNNRQNNVQGMTALIRNFTALYRPSVATVTVRTRPSPGVYHSTVTINSRRPSPGVMPDLFERSYRSRAPRPPTQSQTDQRLTFIETQRISPRSTERNADCVICLDTPVDRINVPCCRKPFCKDCLRRSISTKYECPACRSEEFLPFL